MEYEGLHLICFNCGMYGHKASQCLDLMEKPVENLEDKASKNSKEVDPNSMIIAGSEGLQEDRGKGKNLEEIFVEDNSKENPRFGFGWWCPESQGNNSKSSHMKIK